MVGRLQKSLSLSLFLHAHTFCDREVCADHDDCEGVVERSSPIDFGFVLDGGCW